MLSFVLFNYPNKPINPSGYIYGSMQNKRNYSALAKFIKAGLH